MVYINVAAHFAFQTEFPKLSSNIDRERVSKWSTNGAQIDGNTAQKPSQKRSKDDTQRQDCCNVTWQCAPKRFRKPLDGFKMLGAWPAQPPNPQFYRWNLANARLLTPHFVERALASLAPTPHFLLPIIGLSGPKIKPESAGPDLFHQAARDQYSVKMRV